MNLTDGTALYWRSSIPPRRKRDSGWRLLPGFGFSRSCGRAVFLIPKALRGSAQLPAKTPGLLHGYSTQRSKRGAYGLKLRRDYSPSQLTRLVASYS